MSNKYDEHKEDIVIEKRRSHYIIHNYPRKLLYKGILERSLSVYDFHARTYTMELYHHDDVYNKMRVPKGISEDHLLMMLRTNPHIGNIQMDNRKDEELPSNPYKILNKKIQLKPKFKKPRDDHQVESIDFLTTDIQHKPQRFVTLDTGMGKTYVTVAAILKLGFPAIIISKNLSTQWIQRIIEYTGCDPDKYIYEIKGSESVEFLSKQRSLNYMFYVASTTTVASFINDTIKDEEVDYYKFNNILKKANIGIKVIDEAHQNLRSHVLIDLYTDVKLNFYLTATPLRSSAQEKALYKKIFTDHIPAYGAHTKYLNSYYNIIFVKYDSRPKDFHKAMIQTRRGFNGKMYLKYIMRSEPRRRLFLKIMSYYISNFLKHTEKHEKMMIVLDSLESIKFFSETIGVKYGMLTGRYCTLVPKKERKKELDHRIIFTTIGSGGTGLDIKGLRILLCLSPFSSEVIQEQLLGRLRYIEDKEVYFIDSTDTGFEGQIYQSNVRKKGFEKKMKTSQEKEFKMDYVSDYQYTKEKYNG